VDFSLKLYIAKGIGFSSVGFNPCFGGFFSKTLSEAQEKVFRAFSFNPCFGGFFSKTRYEFFVDVWR